jgi:Cu-processing system permease protein
MNRITRFILADILRSKIILAYAVLLSILSWSVFSLEDNSSKGMLTLLSLLLLSVPLVSVIFSTIYLYNSSEFIELLLSQPVRRSRIWCSLFSGLLTALTLALLVGVGIPVLIFVPPARGLMLLFAAVAVSAVFVSIAFLASILTRDKARGIGIAILLWLFFALLFDGLVLFLLFQLADYPIEKMMVVLSALNPIDLARILVLLQTDVSAMMGYTGAVFRDVFGTATGIAVSGAILLAWTLVPFLVSLRKFKSKDL